MTLPEINPEQLNKYIQFLKYAASEPKLPAVLVSKWDGLYAITLKVLEFGCSLKGEQAGV